MEKIKKFPATKDEYYSMLDYVMGEAEESGMSPKQMTRLELGFEEAAANVINYAYKEGEIGEIEIKTYCDGERFFIELRDSGEKFDPLAVDTKIEKPTSVENAKIGGLGIVFMRQIFDDMSYHYGQKGDLFYNTLKLGIKLVAK